MKRHTSFIETPSPFDPIEVWENFVAAMQSHGPDDADAVAAVRDAKRMIAEIRAELEQDVEAAHDAAPRMRL